MLGFEGNSWIFPQTPSFGSFSGSWVKAKWDEDQAAKRTFCFSCWISSSFSSRSLSGAYERTRSFLVRVSLAPLKSSRVEKRVEQFDVVGMNSPLHTIQRTETDEARGIRRDQTSWMRFLKFLQFVCNRMLLRCERLHRSKEEDDKYRTEMMIGR